MIKTGKEVRTTKLTQIKQIIPGLLLSLAVAAAAKGGAIFSPQLGGATLAILLGIILGNTLFSNSVYSAGTKFSEKLFLEISVVLLGLTVTFQTISQLGISGFLYIVLQMLVTIGGVFFIGKKLGFNQSMTLLMAGGNAVCGSSAIASIAPVIKAKDEEKGQIITLVNLLGTVMMLTLPFLGGLLFSGDLLKESALLGGTLQSVGQVVAGASLRNPETVQYAMLFKILRIMFLVVVVLGFEKMAAQTNQTADKRKIHFPWYVSGFLICCILNSFIHLPQIVDASSHFISTWLETTALAAIGLRLDLRKFVKEGPRLLIFGVSVGCLQIICAVLLIFLLGI